MTAIIGRKGAVIYEQDWINHIGIDKFCALKRGFTRTIKLPHNQFKKAVIAHSENTTNGKIWIIDRFYAQILYKHKLFKSLTSALLPGEKINITNWACRPYLIQNTVHDYIMNNHFNPDMVKLGFSGLTLELEAGLGKTFVAAMICNTLKLKTVYIVPSSEWLLEQAEDDFKKCFPEMKLGRYYGKAKYDGDVVFMIINSVLSKEFTLDNKKLSPKDFFKRFGLAIWDEAHEYSTKSRSKAFSAVNTKYMLGITAEANNREDKMDFISHYGIGLPVYSDKIPGFDLPNDDRYKSEVTIVRYSGHPNYCHNLVNESTGMMSTSKMSKQIIKDPYRMELVMQHAMELYTSGHNFFLWCDMRACVYILRDILKKLGVNVFTPEIEGNVDNNISLTKNVAHLMGGTTKEEMIQAQNARVIIATYQYAYRGVSLPKFDAMIFVTPRRAKIYQTLKRIFRMGGDTTIVRKIIDFVDVKTKLKNQLTDRKKQYTSNIFDMKIINKKIEYTSVNLINKKLYEDIVALYIED